jgi:hypothetical protein
MTPGNNRGGCKGTGSAAKWKYQLRKVLTRARLTSSTPPPLFHFHSPPERHLLSHGEMMCTMTCLIFDAAAFLMGICGVHGIGESEPIKKKFLVACLFLFYIHPPCLSPLMSLFHFIFLLSCRERGTGMEKSHGGGVALFRSTGVKILATSCQEIYSPS